MREPRQMPIFSRTFHLLSWLLPATHEVPRAHRHDFTRRLLPSCRGSASARLPAALPPGTFTAGRAGERGAEAEPRHQTEHLHAADEALARLRLYLRLAVHRGWLTGGQYKHAAAMLAEVGRLFGGWHRMTAGPPAAALA
jgi:hypothetical protein